MLLSYYRSYACLQRQFTNPFLTGNQENVSCHLLNRHEPITSSDF